MWYDGQNLFFCEFFLKLQNRLDYQPGWNELRRTHWLPGLSRKSGVRQHGAQRSSYDCWDFAAKIHIIIFPQKYNLLQGHNTNRIFVWKYKLLWSQRLHNLFFSEVSVCSNSTRVLNVSRKYQTEKGGWRSYKGGKSRLTAAGKNKIFDVELRDRQSGLFSKYWRVFKGLSKLPLDREVDVARKK